MPVRRKRPPPPSRVDLDEGVVSDVLALVAKHGNLSEACAATPGGPKPGDVRRWLRSEGMADVLTDALAEYASRETRVMTKRLLDLADNEIDMTQAPVDPDERRLWLDVAKFNRRAKADALKFSITALKPDGPKMVQNNDNRSVGGPISPIALAFQERRG